MSRVYSIECFEGRTVRTVIDGSFTPPAIFFEELIGHDRLGETVWHTFEADGLTWGHFAVCLVKSALRAAARGADS